MAFPTLEWQASQRLASGWGEQAVELLRFEARDTFRVSPEQLWPLLADTSRLNQAIGLPPVEWTVRPAETGGSLVQGRVRLFGLMIAHWTEHPFRWEEPRGYVVVREFHSGLIRRLRVGVDLLPLEGGTELRAFADVTPACAVGAALIRHLLGPRMVQKVVEQVRRFELYLLGQASDPFPQLARRRELPSMVKAGSDELVRRGIDPTAVQRLRRYLAEARDDDLVKMRPFELADRWELDRRDTLALFLHATIIGLLVMTWEVLCPNCRVSQQGHTSLRKLTTQAHCAVCNIAFDTRLDRLVEARFTVSPALRRVKSRQFCLGGPMNTPHIVSQVIVGSGATEQLAADLAPGVYRLRFSPSGAETIVDARSAAQPAQPSVLQSVLTATAADPLTADVPPGPLRLKVANQTDQPQLVVLEGSVWPDTAATAALVSTMQEFRDLFSSEALAPDVQLGIENLAFLFTDLTGSTALYQQIGQARAFRLVQDHFKLLSMAIRQQRGAVVKTIGDAVMAVFSTGADALGAALQIQRDIHKLTVPPGVDASRLVKVGVHQGPCVAVTLNERLDYFGTTVNTAARIEHACGGGQIVASLAACQSEAARSLLQNAVASYAEEIVRLRGLAEPIPVYRITPSQGGSQPRGHQSRHVTRQWPDTG